MQRKEQRREPEFQKTPDGRNHERAERACLQAIGVDTEGRQAVFRCERWEDPAEIVSWSRIVLTALIVAEIYADIPEPEVK